MPTNSPAFKFEVWQEPDCGGDGMPCCMGSFGSQDWRTAWSNARELAHGEADRYETSPNGVPYVVTIRDCTNYGQYELTARFVNGRETSC